MPVATVRMFGSKMMSSAGKPTFSVSSSYARWQMRTLSSTFDGLPLLVERHHDDRRAVPAAKPRAAQELGLAVLEADRVDDRLALQRLEARFEHRPLAAVDHHRHGGDVVLAGDQPQELGHHGFAVEQGLVHVDVDDVRAALDLLRATSTASSYFSSLISRANLREPVTFVRSPIMRKLLSGRSASGRVPLSRSVRRDGRRLVRLRCRRTASAIARDVLRRRAAAAADDVHPAALGELAHHAGHVGRAEIVLAHLVRQAGVRMATDPAPATLAAALPSAAASAPGRARSSCRPRASGSARPRSKTLRPPGRRRTSPRPCRTCRRSSPARGSRCSSK